MLSENYSDNLPVCFATINRPPARQERLASLTDPHPRLSPTVSGHQRVRLRLSRLAFRRSEVRLLEMEQRSSVALERLGLGGLGPEAV